MDFGGGVKNIRLQIRHFWRIFEKSDTFVAGEPKREVGLMKTQTFQWDVIFEPSHWF